MDIGKFNEAITAATDRFMAEVLTYQDACSRAVEEAVGNGVDEVAVAGLMAAQAGRINAFKESVEAQAQAQARKLK